jgi:methyl-accepting chemotaxis protein
MRLYEKIILLIAVVTLGIGIIIGIIVDRVMKNYMQNDLKNRGIFIARMVAENIVDMIYTGDVIFVTEYLKNIAAHTEDIEYLYVEDFNNKIFAHSFDGGFPRALMNEGGKYHASYYSGHKMKKYKAGDKFIIEFGYPVIPGTLVDVHIGINQNAVLSRIVSVRRQIAVITLVIAAIGFAIGIVISYFITYPLNRLGKYMEKFDIENPGEINIKTGSREVMELVNSFNGMREGVVKAKEESHYYIEELKKGNEKLENALSNIKTLRGFIPICASCKKVRDDKGFWKQVEAYVSEHSEAEFSHGICPNCMKKLYPEYRI